MKKHILIFIFLLLSGVIKAQESNMVSSETSKSNSGKSLVKINLLSLPLKNYSLGYEYKLGNKITAGLGFRFMPNGKLPMLSKIKKIDPITSSIIKEEININIDILDRLSNSIYDYGTFKINLIPYTANYISGEIVLSEHKDYILIDKSELKKLSWAEADLPIVNELLKLEI
jgi:hypothetical protein